MFLRTAEKKREASRPKEAKDSEPATPVEPTKQTLTAIEASVAEISSEQNSGVDATSGQVDGTDNVDEGSLAQSSVQVLINHWFTC